MSSRRLLPPKPERRDLLRSLGWHQIGGNRGAEMWAHPAYPSSHWTLAAAWKFANGHFGRRTA